jgi:FAD-linked oxidoreductase
MKNWSGCLEFHPEHIYTPQSEEDIIHSIELARSQKKSLRPIGSGHSWTSLFNTDEYLLDLSEYSGMTQVESEFHRMTFKSGTKMSKVTDLLLEHQLSLENQGDINSQAIAGALSTGTHGTGEKLCSMANQMHQFKLITAGGEVKTIHKHQTPELFQAAAVSMGLMGIVSEIEVQAMPLYQLQAETEAVHFSEILPQLDQLVRDNRHFELFYFPIGDWALMKRANITQKSVAKKSLLKRASHYLNDVLIENALFELANQLAHKTNRYHAVDKMMRKFVSKTSKIDYAQNIFPTQRSVKFMEMEYNVDRNDFARVLNEIQALLKTANMLTLFPIEIRFVASDNLWLSPAYQRESVYFAIHTYIEEEYLEYFKAMESIFKRYQGRPHWGKWHSLKSEDLQKVYPRYNDFLSLRRELDPQGVFVHARNSII